MYTCPVCYYENLEYPPEEDGTICPCCGIHFAYEGYGFNKDEDEMIAITYRLLWILNDMKWWSNYTKPPSDWNPVKQLDKFLKL